MDKSKILRAIIFIPLIFSIVCFAWIFFRANNLSDALTLIGNINLNNIANINNGKMYELGLVKPEFILSIVVILCLIVFEWLHKKYNLRELLSKQIIPIRWICYSAISLIIIIFGIYGEGQVSEFIYFQF